MALLPAQIAFLSPWLLLGLLALPLLWWLLRAVPPAPVHRRFPAVVLLLGLRDEDTTPVRTPWWLLLLRCAAAGLLILGFAGPVLNPERAEPGRGPLMVAMDGSWASAADWGVRVDRAAEALQAAARQGRPVALWMLSDPPAGAGGPVFRPAQEVAQELAALRPQPRRPDYAGLAARLDKAERGEWETLWISDGLDHPGRAALLRALRDRGRVSAVESGRAVLALTPPDFTAGTITVGLLQAGPAGATGAGRVVRVRAVGPDPTGQERVLSVVEVPLAPGDARGQAEFDLPVELRNRLTRFEIEGGRGAGGVLLLDDSLRRKKVALLDGGSDAEADDLLKPLHYLRQALRPTAELIEADLQTALRAAPDVVILADVATLAAGEAAALQDWVERGGLLVRFAGPRLAASTLDRSGEDPLLPVRLRVGGRTVGGAMSWGQPKTLQPFPETSPFHGLAVPDDVTVTSQVVAQPGPDLAARVIAALADGTPLVTARPLGAGRVVLFHVTANAEWSTLPLSGLFVAMLERLAVVSGPPAPDDAVLTGQNWVPQKFLDGFGGIHDAGGAPGVAGARLAAALRGEDWVPPGIYATAERSVAVNVIGPEGRLARQVWPADLPVLGLVASAERRLAGPVLALALALMLLDVMATLWMGGRLGGLAGGRSGAATGVGAAGSAGPAGAAAGRPGGIDTAGMLAPMLLALTALFGAGLGWGGLPAAGWAQSRPTGDELARLATRETVLAYVLTGDPAADELSRAGLLGLSRVLSRRTSIEPGPPIGVDLARDELALFPLLYWPVTERQAALPQEVQDKLNAYLRHGGMILFDTRDANLGGGGFSTPNGRALRRLTAGLAIPPLEPVPGDHVLTRAFYLLQEFPGRYRDGDVWVEAAPRDAERVPGMPFRSLNDGVTPVVIGANDWAAAWAMNDRGQPLYPVGRGGAGERQREMAYRFGVNLVMHVLTGNYKSDQVHVPALLERLGQ